MLTLPARHGAWQGASAVLATAAWRWLALRGGGLPPPAKGRPRRPSAAGTTSAALTPPLSALRKGPAAVTAVALPCLAVFAVAGGVDLAVRLWRGQALGALGALWLAPATAATLGLGLWAWGRRGRLRRWIPRHRGPALAWGAGLLFLPLPVLRWWGGRHLLVTALVLAAALALSVAARRARCDGPRFWGGVGLLVATALGAQLTALGAPRAAAQDLLAWGVAVLAPPLLLTLGGAWRSAAPMALALSLGGWAAAHLPRLAGTGDPRLILAALIAAAVGIAWQGRGGRALLVLLWVGARDGSSHAGVCREYRCRRPRNHQNAGSPSRVISRPHSASARVLSS